ncbi:hypothetical protein FHG87_022996, partial [Trinorchestia longiramus]
MLGRLVSESACEREDPGSNPAADMVDAARNTAWDSAHTSAYVDTEKEKKLAFLTRQLELLSQKQFSMNDYCFALQSYPK